MLSQQNIKSTHVYYGLAIVIMIFAVAYGLLQFKLMQAQAVAIEDNKRTAVALDGKLAKLNEYYAHFAANQVETQAQLSRSLEDILPVGENYTDLTRTFDNFFAEHDSEINPIVQTSMRFGKGVPVEGMPLINALPITMNIDGTRENFFAFLNFINQSGTLTSRNRVIAIKSIQLNFPDGGEVLNNLRQVINVTIDMEAYYRK